MADTDNEKRIAPMPRTSRTARIWAWIIILIIVAAVAWLFCRSCVAEKCNTSKPSVAEKIVTDTEIVTAEENEKMVESEVDAVEAQAAAGNPAATASHRSPNLFHRHHSPQRTHILTLRHGSFAYDGKVA